MPENFEQNNFKITDVTLQNLTLLIAIRKEVDEVDEDKLRREVEKYSTGNERKAFLVQYGEVVAGYVEVNLNEELTQYASKDIEGDIVNFAHLARIGVSKKYRNNYLGSKLLEVAEQWAITNGKSGMWIDFLDSNTAARGLYLNNGYLEYPEHFPDLEWKKRCIALKKF